MLVHLCVYVSMWDRVLGNAHYVRGCICMFVACETVCVLAWLSRN